MAGSNLPPGVTVGMIPGNRPEDTAWETFEDWALAELTELSLDEAYRAVSGGIAAVKAEREFVKRELNDAMAEQAEYISYLRAQIEKLNGE